MYFPTMRFMLTTMAISSTFTSAAMHTPSLTLRVADQSRGLLTLSFDPSKDINESVQLIGQNDAGFQPNWLFPYQDKIYSISRTQYPDEEDQSGGLFEFAKHDAGLARHDHSSLRLLSNSSSDGLGGVYVGVSKDGRTLSAANIDGSTISIHPLASNGAIGEASFVFKFNLEHPGPGTNESQLISNPHETIFEPSGRYMFVPDRGADRLYVYDIGGPYDLILVKNISLPLGTGPRHMTFRPYNATRTFAYLVSELDNTVRVFTLDGFANKEFGGDDCVLPRPSPHQLQIELLQVASTLRPGDTRTAPNNQDLAAEVSLSDDGKYAYVSNRNTISLDPDNIAIYSVDATATVHHLTWIGQSSTHGKIPRHFSLSTDPENKYIAVANQVTQSVIILERDAHTGLANNIAGKLSLGDLDLTQSKGPRCVIWD